MEGGGFYRTKVRRVLSAVDVRRVVPSGDLRRESVEGEMCKGTKQDTIGPTLNSWILATVGGWVRWCVHVVWGLAQH